LTTDTVSQCPLPAAEDPVPETEDVIDVADVMELIEAA